MLSKVAKNMGWFRLSLLMLSSEKDLNLWVQVLTYFARKEENCQKEIMEVLGCKTFYNRLSPIKILTEITYCLLC